MSRLPHGRAASQQAAAQLKETARKMKSSRRQERMLQPTKMGSPSLYTYFGQFLDHEISFEARSKPIPKLTDSKLTPMSRELIQASIYNGRSPRLDLNSIYGETPELNEELRDGARMRLGKVATPDFPGFRFAPPGATILAPATRAQERNTRPAL